MSGEQLCLRVLYSGSFRGVLVQSQHGMRKILQVIVALEGIVRHEDAPIFVLLGLNAPVGAVHVKHALIGSLLNLESKAVILNCFFFGRIFNSILVVVEVLLVLGERHLALLFCILIVLVLYHLGQQAKVLKEVIFVLVLRVDLQDANDAVVALVNQVVQLRSILESDHAVDDILLEDFVRVAADLLQALRSLVHVLVLRVIRVIACLSISIVQVILVVDWILNLAAIEHLASIVVADFVANRLILSCLGGVH